jgi:hypothetical protein
MAITSPAEAAAMAAPMVLYWACAHVCSPPDVLGCPTVSVLAWLAVETIPNDSRAKPVRLASFLSIVSFSIF